MVVAETEILQLQSASARGAYGTAFGGPCALGIEMAVGHQIPSIGWLETDVGRRLPGRRGSFTQSK